MRFESLRVSPCRKNREVVRTRRTFLKHVIPHGAFVLTAFFRDSLEQGFGVFSARGRDVNMRDYRYGVARDRNFSCIDRQPLVHTLIVRAAVNRSKPGSKISSMVGLFMRLEGCLISPDLKYDKPVRSADFLYHVDAYIPSLFLRGVAILLNKRNALAGQ